LVRAYRQTEQKTKLKSSLSSSFILCLQRTFNTAQGIQTTTKREKEKKKEKKKGKQTTKKNPGNSSSKKKKKKKKKKKIFRVAKDRVTSQSRRRGVLPDDHRRARRDY